MSFIHQKRFNLQCLVSFKNRYVRAGGVAQVVECLPSKYEALYHQPPPKKTWEGSLIPPKFMAESILALVTSQVPALNHFCNKITNLLTV
jgi:hypothetical protein